MVKVVLIKIISKAIVVNNAFVLDDVTPKIYCHGIRSHHGVGGGGEREIEAAIRVSHDSLVAVKRLTAVLYT